MRYKIIQTAGGSIIIFNNWEIYRRFFSANSGSVMIMPNISTA